MNRMSRRAVLTAMCGFTTGSIAGCLESSSAADPERIEATPDALSSVPDGATIAVFPADLRGWVGDALSENREVRVQTRPKDYDVRAHETHGDSFFPLDDVDEAMIVEVGSTERTYQLDASVDTGNPNLYRAEAEDSQPADGTVIHTEDLAKSKREFVIDVLDANPYGSETVALAYDPDVFDWADAQLVGSYVEHGGSYYRIEPTYYQTPTHPPSYYSLTIRAEEFDATDPVRFVLPDPSTAVDAVIEEALREGSSEDPANDAVAFAQTYEYILTVSTVWRLSIT